MIEGTPNKVANIARFTLPALCLRFTLEGFFCRLQGVMTNRTESRHGARARMTHQLLLAKIINKST